MALRGRGEIRHSGAATSFALPRQGISLVLLHIAPAQVKIVERRKPTIEPLILTSIKKP